MGRPHMHGERKVKVNTKKLVAQLKENLIEHEAAYEEAQEGYLTGVTNALVDVQAQCQKDLEGLTVEDVMGFRWDKLLEPLSKLEKPKSYAQAYREAIEFFEWDERETLELTFSEFRKFVLNEWDWSENFWSNSAGYGSETASRKMSG